MAQHAPCRLNSGLDCSIRPCIGGWPTHERLGPRRGTGRDIAKPLSRRYTRGRIETPLPRALDQWAMAPAPTRIPRWAQLATLWLENAAPRAEKAIRQECMRELEAQLGQDSSNSSGPRRRIHSRPRYAPRPHRPATSEVDSQDTRVPSVPCCRSSRWT